MEPEPKHATIIGASGFVGTALQARLRALGWSCTVPNRHAASQPVGSLGHIFYCAGMTADYAKNPADTVEAHVALLSRVLTSQDWDSLVYLSSTRLYDGQPPERSGVEEGAFLVDPDNMRHLYDLSKLLGENLCRVMGPGKARVARLSCVYRDERDPHGFIGDLMRKILNTPSGSILSVDSSPHFQRDYVHIDDVVEGLIKIAVGGRSPVYNLAFGSNTSNADLADAVYRCTGVHIAFNRSDAPSTSPLLRHRRLTEEFGWHPQSPQKAIGAWAARNGRAGATPV